MRVFTTTSLFQRLTLRDKFQEDKVDITLFKQKALICKDNPKKFDLDVFSDIANSVKYCPVYDCLPFLSLPFKSRELLEKQTEEERKGGSHCFVYVYKVTPQSLNRDDLIALQRRETDEKTGGDAFRDYLQWRNEAEKKIKNKNNRFDAANQGEKRYYPKKDLV